MQAAQIVHAAGESSPGDLPEGTHAVVLAVDDEAHLLHVAEQLHWAEIPYKLIVEPDLPLHPDRPLEDGQGTALGLLPTTDRRAVARVLGRLPLLR